MNREEFILEFKSRIKVGFLNANESLQHLKQKKISNDNEHHRLYTFLLRFGELKKKFMYYLYNIDLNHLDFVVNEIHEVMVEILNYYNSNTDVVILCENLSTQQNDTFEKENGYLNLCKDIQEYYLSSKRSVEFLKTKLSEYD
jgi:hypothetical protein